MSRSTGAQGNPFGDDEDEILRTYQVKSLEPQTWSIHNEDLNDNDTSEVSSGTKRDDSDPLGLRPGSILKAGNAPDLSFDDKVSILLHSKSFNPKTFLSSVHPNATLSDLSHGRDHLKDSLQQRSKALRTLVEKEFDHFVNVKSATDGVYEEMKQGPLRAENEYGVKALKDALAEASSRADSMYTPILDATQKADRLRTTLNVLERSSFFFNLPSILSEAIESSKYDAALMAYKKGLYMRESRTTLLLGNQPVNTITEAQRLQCSRIFDKVWSQVEAIVADMKSNLEKRLQDRQAPLEEIEKYLDVLLEFDNNDESIWIFFNSRHQYILNIIEKRYLAVSKRHSEILKELSDTVNEDTSLLNLQSCFRGPDQLDDRFILEGTCDVNAWKALLQVVRIMLETTLTNFTPFWKLGRMLMDGKYQKKHSPNARQAQAKFQSMAHEILQKLISILSDFFELSVKAPERPTTGDKNEIPPLPSFAPTISNAFTGGSYLQIAITEIHECTEDLGALNLSSEGNMMLKEFVSSIREKFEETLCIYWVKDVKHFYRLETWTPDVDYPHTTDFWRKMGVYQKQVLKSSYRIAAGSEESAESFFADDSKDNNRVPKPRRDEVLSPQCVKRAQAAYLDTLYAFLDGLVHVAFSPVMNLGDHDGSVSTMRKGADIDNVDVRILLTISNLSHFHTNVLPKWIQRASEAYGKDMSDDVKTLSEVVSQLDKILFDDLVRRRSEDFAAIMHRGVLGPDVDWLNAPKPTEVQPYIYHSLLSLVLAHSLVGAVSKPLTDRVIKTIINELVKIALECFSQVKSFGLGGMLQATLEVEFMHQTLQSHISPEAEANLQEIYKIISQTYYQNPSANSQKQELQVELEQLKKTLSASTRATALQFLCFRGTSKS